MEKEPESEIAKVERLFCAEQIRIERKMREEIRRLEDRIRQLENLAITCRIMK